MNCVLLADVTEKGACPEFFFIDVGLLKVNDCAEVEEEEEYAVEEFGDSLRTFLGALNENVGSSDVRFGRPLLFKGAPDGTLKATSPSS